MPVARKDYPCLYCGKLLTRKGVYEHERHACKKNPHRRKRSFGKKRCAVCGKSIHAAGLRAHYATQHPLEFASDRARRKPSSRAARRREMVARAEGSRARRHERSTQNAGDHRHSPHRHATTPPAATTKVTKQRDLSNSEQPNKLSDRRTSGGASRRAWAKMEQKMSKAASK